MNTPNRAPVGSVKAAIQKANPTNITLRDFVQQSGLNYRSVAAAARAMGIKFLDGRCKEHKRTR